MEDEEETPSAILPHLYLGSRVHARSRDMLKSLNVSHILNVTPSKNVDPVAGVPNFFEKNKTFVYRRCSLYDNQAEDILRSLDACISFIEQGKHYGSVLVHCNKGVSRSTSIVVAYLMKIKQMTLNDALAYVKARRAVANPNESFLRQLAEYERRLQRQKVQEEEREQRERKGPSYGGYGRSKGPIGPAIGPCMPPGPGDMRGVVGPTQNPSMAAERKRKRSGPPVGPSLPSPSLKCAGGDGSRTESDGEGKRSKHAERSSGSAIGPAIGPTIGPAIGPTIGPAIGPTIGPAIGPTIGPPMGPAIGPPMGPAIGPPMGPSIGPPMGPAIGPTMGPAIGPTAGSAKEPVMEPGVGPAMRPATERSIGPANGPTIEPTMRHTMGPAVGPTLGPSVKPSTGPADTTTTGPTKGHAIGATVGPTNGPSTESTIGPAIGHTRGHSMGPTVGPAKRLRPNSEQEDGHKIGSEGICSDSSRTSCEEPAESERT